MIKRGKKGQFYIIVAVALVVVIAGIITITNYATTAKRPAKFYDLSEDLGIESEKVVTYGIYKEGYTGRVIEEFADSYSDYFDQMAGKGEKVFVYGNENNISMLVYTNVTKGRISLGLGKDSPVYLDVEGKDKKRTSLIPIMLPRLGEDIVINITNKEYKFTLSKGENFYFVLTKKIGNDTYVTRG